MSRTFQNLQLFPSLSVVENVTVGRHRHRRAGIVAAALALPASRADARAQAAAALGALEQVGLGDVASAPAGSLPFGRQKLVEVARALASEPALLLLDGQRIGGRPPEAILRAGIALVPERRRVFTALSVRDNLVLGAYSHRRARGFTARLEAELAPVHELFPILRERARQAAGTLSGGEQQMLAIGRALMSRPHLLLCDEPSQGLTPLIVQEIMRRLARFREAGTTVLLVEQNARAALRASDRAYVLETGEVRLAGPARELLADAALVSCT